MKLHVIGNSHVSIFAGTSEILTWYPPNKHVFSKDEFTFHVYHVGPIIAYNFFEHHYGKVNEILANVANDFNKEEDYIMIVIGEGDCRWHLPRQASLQNKDIHELVQECVDRFFRVIQDLQSRGYKCICWGGHPSTNSGHNDDPNCPVFGAVETRNRISRHFCSCFRTKCNEHNVPFVSIMDNLIESDGTTNMSYFVDYCHLNHDMVFDVVLQEIRRELQAHNKL